MIISETLNFLADLKQNNNREWFQANKQRYEAARYNAEQFTTALIAGLSKVDPNVDTGTDAAKCVMRIYRDIRFSKDKTPYKTFFGIHNLTAGKYADRMGYFIHLEPGNSYVAGGYWMPEGEHLKAIRQEIDYNADDLKEIVDKPAFKKLFGEFRDQERLKTVPGGYDAANENISLIKLKTFGAVHNLKDADLQQKDIAVKIAGICKEIYPLLQFLKNAITT